MTKFNHLIVYYYWDTCKTNISWPVQVRLKHYCGRGERPNTGLAEKSPLPYGRLAKIGE